MKIMKGEKNLQEPFPNERFRDEVAAVSSGRDFISQRTSVAVFLRDGNSSYDNAGGIVLEA